MYKCALIKKVTSLLKLVKIFGVDRLSLWVLLPLKKIVYQKNDKTRDCVGR
jgi:hypothetical protein